MTPPVTGTAKKWNSGKRKIPSSASASTWRKRAFGARPKIRRCVRTPKTKSNKRYGKRKTCLRPTRGTFFVSSFKNLTANLRSRRKEFLKETESKTESEVYHGNAHNGGSDQLGLEAGNGERFSRAAPGGGRREKWRRLSRHPGSV